MDIMEFEELQKVTGNKSNKKENKHLAALKSLIGIALLIAIPVMVIGPAELWDCNIFQKIALISVMTLYVLSFLGNLAGYIFTRKTK